MAKRFTPEQERILNEWARTASELRRAFTYTSASNTQTQGFGFHLNKEIDPDGRFYIEVRESDGAPVNELTSILTFNSDSFYLERTTNPRELMVNFRGSTGGGSGSGVTDHGDLGGLADDDHPQYLLRTETPPGFYGIIVKESDGTYTERDDTVIFASDDFDLSTVDGKPLVALGNINTSEAFYMAGNGDLSAITRNITLQYPSRRDTITFFSSEADFRITKMRAILRQNDSGFYPYVNFTLRHSSSFPSRLSGTELVTGGWQCGFYPGHPYLTADKNPLTVTSFNSSTIPKDSYVWLETTNLGEGDGIEEELAISLWIER